MASTIAKNAKAAGGALLMGSILATAVPANAQHRGDNRDRHYDRRHDGIDAGDVIAGAIIIGGLAAILSSGNRGGRNDRYDRYDRNYDGYDWDRYGGSREAIQRCVNAVERRGGWRDDVDVRRVTDIDRIRGGYRISGNVSVNYNGGYRGDWRDDDRRGYDGQDRYDDRDRNDQHYDDRGRNDRRYDDRGRFTCTVRYGRVDDVDLRGV